MIEHRGGLIAFEGIEGSGKSTHIQLVAEALRHEGRHARQTREPGGTALGVEIRRAVMHFEADVPAPLTELLLYLADRAQHIEAVIRPALEAGELVLTDRFSASTIAYQGYGRGLDLATVRQLDALVRGGVSPALTILLNCPVEVGLARVRGHDRFHRAELAFHERVREGFLAQAAEDPERILVIDSTRDRDTVHAEALNAVRIWLRQT